MGFDLSITIHYNPQEKWSKDLPKQLIFGSTVVRDPDKLGFDFTTYFINHPREFRELSSLCSSGVGELSEETMTWLKSQDTALLNEDNTATDALNAFVLSFARLGLSRFSQQSSE